MASSQLMADDVVLEAQDQVKQQEPKWKGKASEEMAGVKAELIWPFLEDFFGLHKWFPTLTTCMPVEGSSVQPGCVRYCAGFRTPVDKDDDGKETVNWTKQKLLSIDPAKMTLTYSIIDGNVGFNEYVSTVTVVKKEEEGCRIEWEYEVEPVKVKGWTLEHLDYFISTGLKVMAERMKEALQV